MSTDQTPPDSAPQDFDTTPMDGWHDGGFEGRLKEIAETLLPLIAAEIQRRETNDAGGIA